MTGGERSSGGSAPDVTASANPFRAIAPLLVNGYALVFNAGLTAVLGVVFWFAAARLYSQEQVGLAAALISSMTTISYFAQMNLGSLLTRFLPSARAGARGLITRVYAVAGLATAVAATVLSPDEMASAACRIAERERERNAMLRARCLTA